MTSRRLTGLGLVALSVLACFHVACGGDDDPARPGTATPDAGTDSGNATTNDAGGQNDSGDAGDGGEGDAGITINGKVVWDSVNVQGVKVVIDGKTATTAANGTFSISGVTAPYTAHVIVPKDLVLLGNTPKDSALVYSSVGLTTANPVLTVAAKSNRVIGTVKGVIAGGSVEQKSDYRVALGAPLTGSNYVSGSGDTSGGSSNISPKAYQLSRAWSSGQSQQILYVSAVEFKYPAGQPIFEGIPLVYSSTAHSIVSVNAGATTDGNLGTFAAVTTKKITGAITMPTGYTILRHQLSLIATGGDSVSFTEDKTATSFDYPVPDDTAAFPEVSIGAAGWTGAGGAFAYTFKRVTPGTADIKLALHEAPVVEKPTENAAGVKAGDTISWKTAGDECLYVVRLSATTDGSTVFALRTTATSATIPDLAAEGASVGASSAYTAVVECLVMDAAKANMDDDAVLGGGAYHAYADAPSRHLLTQ